MTDPKSVKAELENMIKLANLCDERGQVDLADQLTRFANKEIEKAKEDIDAEDAESPVAEGDPLSKGFGRSLVVLLAKLDRICDSNNLTKKLEQICGEKCDADDLYAQLRKTRKLLKSAVG